MNTDSGCTTPIIASVPVAFVIVPEVVSLSQNPTAVYLAGLISFLSPCVLPLVPAYVGYLSGQAIGSTLKHSEE
jgi:cytochrome c biogenesis protein CcdA